MPRSTMRDEALRLAGLGLRVFPLNGKTPTGVKHGCLDATADQIQIESWWERYPRANIGLATGKGIAVVDIDVKTEDRNGVRSLKSLAAGHKWPKTVTARSGSGGWHFFFGVTKDMWVPNNKDRMGGGIEILNEGRYVVAPPSIHPFTGQPYEWVRDPQEGVCAPLPRWLAEANIQSLNSGGTWDKYVEEVKEGEGRNNHLTSYAGALRRQGATKGEIYDALIARNARVCKPPLSVKEVMTIADSISRYKPQDPMVRQRLTDKGNGDRFALLHKGRAIYVPEVGWHMWAGNRWRPVKVEIQELAKRVVEELERAVNDTSNSIKNEDFRKSLQKWAVSSGGKSRIDAMVNLAASCEDLMIDAGRLDRGMYYLNTLNGTLDLKTGKLEDHRSSDLITRMAEVEYDPEAQCPRWETFLEEILPDVDVREYLRRAVGYSLTGSVKEQCFFFLWGSGSNGKSTFIEVIRGMLGSYATQMDSAAVLMGRRDAGGASPDLMKLRGPRFVVAAEAGEGSRLNESVVKALTGQDTITARALYKDFIDFRPHFKLWMHSNYKPRIKGTDRGIWRRVKIIPFTQVFTKPDKDLVDHLRVELPGILNWAIRGYEDWSKWGLREPVVIRGSVKEYKEEMDSVGQFVHEECERREGANTPMLRLWADFDEWQKGLPPRDRMGRNQFYKRMESMGFKRRKKRSKRDRTLVTVFQGIGGPSGGKKPFIVSL